VPSPEPQLCPEPLLAGAVVSPLEAWLDESAVLDVAVLDAVVVDPAVLEAVEPGTGGCAAISRRSRRAGATPTPTSFGVVTTSRHGAHGREQATPDDRSETDHSDALPRGRTALHEYGRQARATNRQILRCKATMSVAGRTASRGSSL
jgi:hypothetical protein